MNILIIGAGHFGQKALRHFRQHGPDAMLTVVDRECRRLSALSDTPNVTLVCADAVDVMNEAILSDPPTVNPDWIIPAVPIHLACEWMLRSTRLRDRIVPIEFPEEIRSKLPNLFLGPLGTVYTSIADFRCPDGCPAPETHCTHTGLPRPLTMDLYLLTIGGDSYECVGIRSVQLGPGVGGYRPKALLQARKRVLAATRPVLLSTACRCHAVISSLRFVPH